jgi:malonyl-ACP decarboxylase
MGVCGAGYPDVAALERLLRQNKTSIQRHQNFPSCQFNAAQIGAILGKIDVVNDLQHSGIEPQRLEAAQKQTRRRSVVYQAAMSAMLQAFHQANLFQQPYDPDEIALIVAGQNLHLNEQYQQYEKFKKEPNYVNPSYAQQFIDTTLMSFLSEFFNIQGNGFQVSAATASGNAAIIQATKILDDKIKCCLVLGPVADLSVVELQAFYNSGALGGENYLECPEKACRPFDQAHNGFIYGQGCGCLVIERKSSAQSRQQPILAQIIGGAMCLDAQSSTAPSLSGEITVMKRVLEQAPKITVDMINTHGTGTPLGDDVEAQAIEAVFANKPFINATKAFIGHTLWSAAVIECIVCILQIQGGFIHGNCNLDNPIHSNLNFVGKSGLSWPTKTALSLSFGFGGINTAILLQTNEENL